MFYNDLREKSILAHGINKWVRIVFKNYWMTLNSSQIHVWQHAAIYTANVYSIVSPFRSALPAW